jgi:DNA protecting protein DprA
MNEENLSILKLVLAADIGPTRMHRLLLAFGSARNVFEASKAELLTVEGISDKIAEAIILIKDSDKAEKELTLAKNNGIELIFFNEAKYPKILKDYDDMPIILYVKGTFIEQDLNSISIVGSRKATNYGKTATSEFSGYFAKRGVTIVSGLARGIDTEAHIAAIQSKGRTIAVLGNGLLVNYPPENTILQVKIPENGAVISEYPLTKAPDKSSFPRRNRIIAAFSKATLVIEAEQQSGALITARCAAEYGKDVFAVPGSIHSDFSKGTNRLIKDGAIPALSPEDMASQMPYLPEETKVETEISQSESPESTLDETENAVLDFISKNDEGVHADLIAQELNIDISQVAIIILKLEVSGLIRTMPGQIYVRVR